MHRILREREKAAPEKKEFDSSPPVPKQRFKSISDPGKCDVMHLIRILNSPIFSRWRGTLDPVPPFFFSLIVKFSLLDKQWVIGNRLVFTERFLSQERSAMNRWEIGHHPKRKQIDFLSYYYYIVYVIRQQHCCLLTMLKGKQKCCNSIFCLGNTPLYRLTSRDHPTIKK